MFLRLFTLTLLLASAQTAESYKILVYCAQFGQSHLFFMGGIADQLVEAGHNVTYLQTELVHTIKNPGSTKANIIVRKSDFDTSVLMKQNDVWKGEFSAMDMINQFMGFGDLLATSCYHLLKDDQFLDRLKAEEFDIAIGEHFDACTYAIFHRLGIKKFISAFAVPIYSGALYQLGLPLTTSFIPIISSPMTTNMTYGERFKNFLHSHVYKEISKYAFGYKINAAASRALGYKFNSNDYAHKSSYYFVNTDEHLDYIQPVTQKVIYIGGLRLKEPKPLTAEFEKIAQESGAGMVLISFGTVALSSKMPNETKNEFVQFINNFQAITFILKYETPEDGYFPEMRNLILSPWVPQSDLLAHPKMLAFITHSGMNSVSEAAHRGVPMLAIPLFGDQQKNAHMAEFRNIARIIKLTNLNSHTLTRELNLLISPTEKYRRSSTHLSQMIQQKPFKASERVVRFTEHAIQFEVAENLDMFARNLSTFEYYGLDVYLPILATFLTILWLMVAISTKLMKLTWHLVSTTRTDVTTKKLN